MMNNIDLIAYGALLLNLTSMTMASMLKLRLLSLLANILYLFYCFLIAVFPLMLGGAVAITIQLFFIHKLLRENPQNQ